MRLRAVAVCGVAAGLILAGSGKTSESPARPDGRAPAAGVAASAFGPKAPASAGTESRTGFEDAARLAWKSVDAGYDRRTGWYRPMRAFRDATVWDLASGLAAAHCAARLGFLPLAEYEARTRLALSTFRKAPLADGVAYTKVYDVSTGRPSKGSGASLSGWSTTDLGRLLVWLRIVANGSPSLEPECRAVAERLGYGTLIRGGYLFGKSVTAAGEVEYQEGQIGFEQYAAAGFRLFGHPAEHALDIGRNAIPIEILGQRLAADLRGRDRLTSEPFVLAGLELGWDEPTGRLARALLAAMEARAAKTGRVVMCSEDAIDRPPHWFYYYCVYTNARDFAVDVQQYKAVVEEPRWVSAKASFAWHALLPSAYTRRAVDAVAAARTPLGWLSGVEEGTGRPIGSTNVNTAAVILEAALYAREKAPLVSLPPIVRPGAAGAAAPPPAGGTS